MAGIHFRRQLIHAADVLETTPAQSTSGELIDTWTTARSINCRLVQKREAIALESLSFQMREVPRLLCDAGENVVEEDRIANVTLRVDGSAIDAGPFDINEVLTRSSTTSLHMSLRLERIE